MATDWQIGDLMKNRWEIHNILQGGMGIVYVVYDQEGSNAFAAKTFKDEAFARNSAVAERFTNEALTWVALDVHQNITHAHFVENIEGKPYLFFEYVGGGDLGGWIGTPRLTEDLTQVLRFAIQFCDGMTHALSKGIRAHRDIKPQNCLITPDITLKVTDFGLAKVFDDVPVAGVKTPDIQRMSISLTRTGMAAGTCTHMAPEQFDDAKHVDVRADVYSFGVMLFQMLAGKLPFVERTWQELERLHKTQPPPALHKRHTALSSIVDTCLAKDPDRRFADFGRVREQLAEIYEMRVREPAPPPVVGRELDALDWNNKGTSLGNLGHREEELVCYGRALELNPTMAQPWNNKGYALHELGRDMEALACYDQALELSPNYGKAWHNKGALLFYGLKRYEEAIVCYDRALELSPRLETAWNEMADLMCASDRTDEAIACYDRALELNPRLELAWINKGLALGSLGWHEKAITCFDRALELSPQNKDAWINKGSALGNSGRHREALVHFEEAQRLGHPQAGEGIAVSRQMLDE